MNKTEFKLDYTPLTSKKYWCHTCKKEFISLCIENLDIQCKFCGKTFCEEIEDDLINNPSLFQPYDPSERNITNNNRQNNNNHSSLLRMIYGMNRPRTSHGLLDLILHYLTIRNYEENMENIINQIMMNDPNKYGNPPASKESIKKLEKFIVTNQKLISFGVENSCAVCKEEFEIKQELMLMPCKHYFHINCLLPWLNERNSCPVCRYELPTDDDDYEQRKKSNKNH